MRCCDTSNPTREIFTTPGTLPRMVGEKEDSKKQSQHWDLLRHLLCGGNVLPQHPGSGSVRRWKPHSMAKLTTSICYAQYCRVGTCGVLRELADWTGNWSSSMCDVGEPLNNNSFTRVIYGDNLAAIGLAHGSLWSSRGSLEIDPFEGFRVGGRWFDQTTSWPEFWAIPWGS